MNFAYVRVSTKVQNEERQIVAVSDYAIKKGIHIDKVYADQAQSDNFQRKEYQKLRECLRDGDNLIVEELDRLGRNYVEIKKEYAYLIDLGVNVHILDLPILDDVEDPALKKLLNDMFLQVLAYVAEREKTNIRKRVKEGMDRAIKNGVRVGRPPLSLPKDFDKHYQKVMRKEITVTDFAKLLGCSRTQVYKYINYYKDQRREEQLTFEAKWVPVKDGVEIQKRYKK